MARRKLPTYPVGTRVHIKWHVPDEIDVDCPGTVLREPAGDSYMWLVDVGDAHDGEPLAVTQDEIVGTLPADDSPEAIRAWLHPAR